MIDKKLIQKILGYAQMGVMPCHNVVYSALQGVDAGAIRGALMVILAGDQPSDAALTAARAELFAIEHHAPEIQRRWLTTV